MRTSTDSRGQVVVEFADTGKGIAAKHLSHIFDPLFTTKPARAGTGLGLAICREILTAHRGTLSVDSQPGHGATFRLTLPPAKAQRRDASPTPKNNVGTQEE